MQKGKITFVELAKKVLTEENKPLSPSEIWAIAVRRGYDSLLHHRGKTPSKTLYTIIFIDERDHEDTIFRKVGSRPARYFLKELDQGRRGPGPEDEAVTEPEIPEEYDYIEKQLHPFLTRFARVQFQAYLKTIDHRAGPKKDFAEWLHPDMVGVYHPTWREEVRNLSKEIGGVEVQLYSFELKRKLGFSNLREAFFQAVSNSS